MEVEEESMPIEFLMGQVCALKNLNKNEREIAELMSSWGYKISHPTVNRYWKKIQNGEIGDNRKSNGR